jgi:hypothetical protein
MPNQEFKASRSTPCFRRAEEIYAGDGEAHNAVADANADESAHAAERPHRGGVHGVRESDNNILLFVSEDEEE